MATGGLGACLQLRPPSAAPAHCSAAACCRLLPVPLGCAYAGADAGCCSSSTVAACRHAVSGSSLGLHEGTAAGTVGGGGSGGESSSGAWPALMFPLPLSSRPGCLTRSVGRRAGPQGRQRSRAEWQGRGGSAAGAAAAAKHSWEDAANSEWGSARGGSRRESHCAAAVQACPGRQRPSTAPSAPASRSGQPADQQQHRGSNGSRGAAACGGACSGGMGSAKPLGRHQCTLRNAPMRQPTRQRRCCCTWAVCSLPPACARCPAALLPCAAP